MLINPNEPFDAQDIEDKVSECEVLVTELKKKGHYLSISYYPQQEKFMVFYQDSENDAEIIENLTSNKAVDFYNKILTTQILQIMRLFKITTNQGTEHAVAENYEAVAKKFDYAHSISEVQTELTIINKQ